MQPNPDSWRARFIRSKFKLHSIWRRRTGSEPIGPRQDKNNFGSFCRNKRTSAARTKPGPGLEKQAYVFPYITTPIFPLRPNSCYSYFLPLGCQKKSSRKLAEVDGEEIHPPRHKSITTSNVFIEIRLTHASHNICDR